MFIFSNLENCINKNKPRIIVTLLGAPENCKKLSRARYDEVVQELN